LKSPKGYLEACGSIWEPSQPGMSGALMVFDPSTSTFGPVPGTESPAVATVLQIGSNCWLERGSGSQELTRLSASCLGGPTLTFSGEDAIPFSLGGSAWTGGYSAAVSGTTIRQVDMTTGAEMGPAWVVPSYGFLIEASGQVWAADDNGHIVRLDIPLDPSPDAGVLPPFVCSAG
jgi:hypothetical protein